MSVAIGFEMEIPGVKGVGYSEWLQSAVEPPLPTPAHQCSTLNPKRSTVNAKTHTMNIVPLYLLCRLLVQPGCSSVCVPCACTADTQGRGS